MVNPEGNVRDVSDGMAQTANGEVMAKKLAELTGGTFAGAGWHFGASGTFDEDDEEYDEDQYIEDEGWLDPHKTFDQKEPLRYVKHEIGDDHYEQDEGSESDSEFAGRGEVHERPLLFDGKRFYAGHPNAYHWDMIQHDPDLKKQFDTSRYMQGGPPDALHDPTTMAYGRWNQEHNSVR